MTHWIVKQTNRVPRYKVEAASFAIEDETVAVFHNNEGAICAAVSDFEYVKMDDAGFDNDVTLSDEEM